LVSEVRQVRSVPAHPSNRSPVDPSIKVESKSVAPPGPLWCRSVIKERASPLESKPSIHPLPTQAMENLIPHYELVVEGCTNVGKQDKDE